MLRSRIALAIALLAALSVVAPAVSRATDSQDDDCTEFLCPSTAVMGWCCGTVAEQQACYCSVCTEDC
jgi:hypothetical protein